MSPEDSSKKPDGQKTRSNRLRLIEKMQMQPNIFQVIRPPMPHRLNQSLKKKMIDKASIMTELIWQGKYDENAKRTALLYVSLPKISGQEFPYERIRK